MIILYLQNLFFAWLGGNVGIGKSRVISALLTLAFSRQQPNFVMIVAQMRIVAINATFNFNFHGSHKMPNQLLKTLNILLNYVC
jgi:hypothetical protein